MSPPRLSGAWLVFLAALAVSACFVLWTDNRWEDYYITYRTSKNLVDGHGLVYQVGERLHTFTSPLGVLLPALSLAVTGGGNDEAALALFRAWAACALGGACVLLWHLAGRWGWTGLARWFVALLPLIEAKTVMFSLNGMETAFMLLFITLAATALSRDLRESWLALGLAWAGLMWTRPDGFVFGGAAALAWMVFRPAGCANLGRAEINKAYAKAAAVAAVIYAPWFLWAWQYYGSPIPHTVLAKGTAATLPHLGDLPALLVNQTVLFPWKGALRGLFLPTYVWFSDWPAGLQWWMNCTAWVAVFYWVVPRAHPIGRAASLTFLLTSLYVTVAPRAPWYLPSHAIMAMVVLGAAIHDLAGLGARRPWARWLAPGLAGLHVLVAVMNLSLAFWHVRTQQLLVENQRREVGLWLKAHRTTERDRVFLEPLGYIGFFSQLKKMLDNPGLAAPEIVALGNRLPHWAAMIGELQPEWLALRQFEARLVHQDNPRLLSEEYQLVQQFDVAAELAAVRYLPGRIHLEYDQTYEVFRRVRK